jgi:hypothetical protein
MALQRFRFFMTLFLKTCNNLSILCVIYVIKRIKRIKFTSIEKYFSTRTVLKFHNNYYEREF